MERNLYGEPDSPSQDHALALRRMTTQIAMIRGINVSGHKSISMERLRGLF
jgi:hypothetical protein